MKKKENYVENVQKEKPEQKKKKQQQILTREYYYESRPSNLISGQLIFFLNIF